MRNLSIFAALLLAVGCSRSPQKLTINYQHPSLKYAGRIDSTSSYAALLLWSGNSVKLKFEGQSIAATLKDETGDNYYNVILDDGAPILLRPDTTRAVYMLASELEAGPHTIELFKRTEWNRGSTSFYGFEINGDPKALAVEAPKKRKMEFFGNSITAAYAVEDLSGADSPDSTYTNFYRSYAYQTAQYFDADYQCTCKSGIGISISWFPLIMPEMYNRLDPRDSTSHWDFLLYTPDLVVINLTQNDSWLVNRPEHEQFKARFGTEKPSEAELVAAYSQFLTSVRQTYPQAEIICALGNMDATQDGSPWPGYVQEAVDQLGDDQIYTHFFPYKNTPGHPSIAEQNAMAKSLIQFIEQNIEW